MHNVISKPSVEATMTLGMQEARRFMNFIDILYDEGCGLIISVRSYLFVCLFVVFVAVSASLPQAEKPANKLLKNVVESEDHQV